MSDATRAALEEAIQAHIADEHDEPVLVTAWILAHASATGDADISNLGYDDSNLAMHEAWGLAKYATKHLDTFYEASNDE